MTRIILALVVLWLANASLATAAVARRCKAKADAVEPPARSPLSAPTLPGGIRLGAVPRTAEGRRALLIQVQKLSTHPVGAVLADIYRTSADFGPALALASVEANAQAWDRPLEWVRDNYHALQTNQIGRDGKPLTPGEHPVYGAHNAEEDPALVFIGTDLHSWQPDKDALKH